MEEIDTACWKRLEIIEKAKMQQEGVTETLKAADQMAWGRSINSINSCKTRNKRWPKKPTQPEKRTGSVGFLYMGLFFQIIRSFHNQPVKFALIGSVLQYPELFKLFFGKGFGNGGSHLALVVQNIFLVEL